MCQVFPSGAAFGSEVGHFRSMVGEGWGPQLGPNLRAETPPGSAVRCESGVLATLVVGGGFEGVSIEVCGRR